MEETQNLVKTSMEEIRGVLSAERVVGEPIVVGGRWCPKCTKNSPESYRWGRWASADRPMVCSA